MMPSSTCARSFREKGRRESIEHRLITELVLEMERE